MASNEIADMDNWAAASVAGLNPSIASMSIVDAYGAVKAVLDNQVPDAELEMSARMLLQHAIFTGNEAVAASFAVAISALFSPTFVVDELASLLHVVHEWSPLFQEQESDVSAPEFVENLMGMFAPMGM